MIKFLELTAPDSPEFRQVKIVSVEVNEGDQVAVGDPLFKVKSGKKKIDLPSTRAGRIAEIIALVDENISLLTPLILLETEVAESSATKPINSADSEAGKKAATAAVRKKAKRKAKRKRAKQKAAKKGSDKSNKSNDQQSLDLDGTETPKADRSVSKSADDATTPEENTESTATSETSKIHKSNAMSEIKIEVPDIGTDSAKVIEILVNVGDEVATEDPLVTLESDKASMDVPSTAAGVVAAIAVEVDQDVSEGSLILTLTAEGEITTEGSADAATEPRASADSSTDQPATAEAAGNDQPGAGTVDVAIPDIGGDSAKVIEILVETGQSVELEDPLVTLESDKASMEVPSSAAGTIVSIEVQLEQDVTEGVVIAKLASTAQPDSVSESAKPAPEKEKPAPAATKASNPSSADTAPVSPAAAPAGKSHASPSIRRFARELGVDLSRV
ncbi:MAG: hypothetical protein HKN85_00340, partial [Gammaproteobacteria bacterium]|nr:hypothetical protein [Gammaproteobacteria bacterium]